MGCAAPGEEYIYIYIYILTSDTHDTHTDAVLSYLLRKENCKESQESVAFTRTMYEEKCIT